MTTVNAAVPSPAPTEPAGAPAPAGGEEFVAAASFAQQRLWVMEQMEDGAATYNIQMGLRLQGALDVPVLRRVLTEILRRHEVLRTRLALEDGELVQLISAEATLPLREVDLRGSADPEGAWQVEAERDLHAPFDVSVQLPLRAVLFRPADDGYVLLLTLDHLVCDARSLQVLHTELISLYPALAAGSASPLPELPVQYADYADWQREWLEGEAQRRQLAYWRGRLGGETPRLTFHRRQDAEGAPANDSRSHPLPDGLVRELEELARREGASLFSVLLSAFGVLIGRYGRQDDFVVGSLLSGRTRPELEDLIGFFVNTVGLRLDLTGRPSFGELLARVHETTLEAYAHQDVPFEQVARDLAPDYEQGRGQPFFDVMFQLADLNRQSLRTPDLAFEPLVMASAPAPVDLVVAVLREEDAYTCVWDFRTDLFGPAGIERMQRQYIDLLHAVVADPDRAVAELARTAPPGTDGAREAAPAPAPGDGDDWNFVRHFDAVARRTPDAPALAAGGETLTYRELAGRADRLAHVLAARGIGPESIVGIHLERGVDQIVSVLATLKAGGAYLPLDPSYPAERIGYMVDDAAPGLVITSRALPGPAAQWQDTAVPVEELTAEAEKAPGTPPAAPETRDGHLAYVIYTSGSTGRPKGTGVPHRGLRVVLDAMDSVLGLTAGDRVLHFASASFDASVFEMLMAFGAGAALHLAPMDRGVPVDLTAFLRERAITALVLPPSALAALVEDAGLPALRTVSVAGEACPPALAARWAGGDRRFFNLYGPTEATIWSAWHRVTPQDTAGVPIGRPVPGTAVYVLDEELRPVPEGAPGELCVAGPTVVRGYLGRPALTAERFVPDPFGGAPGGRLYRTGDLARRNGTGGLEFLGRLDDQVKVRGFRIELGEIERTVAAHPGVREAVALVREDTPGAPAVVAYAVARPGAAPGPEELRELCGRTLPHYMVPSQVVLLDRLPVSGAGKVDRKALPAPERAGTTDAAQAPDGPLEEAIAEIWAEVLGAGSIARSDDFFALGGNSLSATQVIVRLRQDFDLALPVRALFDSTRLGDFTEAVRVAAAAQD
ncbi:amino acid adenylation domain-containing protein [Streptomyces sp. ITFR-16]|uniref:amino acid adenylation domain-containing protein n=1 Tax=Streptomyces sp. ITFR-16 TaxID=3075198 RepID=UPI00288BFC76|nr:amino acid adenylation domain-containing protein [Streptomyces sp. ITFR-16]WNI21512.1 amino acid adenylation domain-containing protein [Streptomyces sp. ITFR-16]